MNASLPETIRDVAELETLLSVPSEAAVAAMSQFDGDIMLLGAGGKMGPSLARMLRNAATIASQRRRIIAVSRFRSPGVQAQLNTEGIETIEMDMLQEGALDSLPDAINIVFMTGSKFGTQQHASSTWAMNVLLPALVCRRFRSSRILAFSTGNVYPFVPIDGGGSVETDALCPVGEYGMSALGRERIFEYHAQKDDIPVAIVRLNYAVEMRYGVTVDLARQVLQGAPIDISMGYANVIWQGDANSMAIAALVDADPKPFIINVAGEELFSVAEICESFSAVFGKPLDLRGTAADTALLNNATGAIERYGAPRVSLGRIISWTADWLRRGMPTWQKPTHFQVRDGQF